MRYFFGCIPYFVTLLFFSSCSTPVHLLKENIQIDTLHIIMDTRPVYPAAFKDSIMQGMQKFVGVYNTEVHPFTLALHQESADYPASITVQFNRIRFISHQQSLQAAGITAAGIGTAAYLLATGFAVPFGWIYIPNAKCAVSPKLNAGISDIVRHQKVMISTPGMFRKENRQQSILSKKLVRYVVDMVLDIENQYKIRLTK